MAYNPNPLSADWFYDDTIDLFSMNAVMPESFPIDVPEDLFVESKVPPDFWAVPTDINGFSVPIDESLSSDQESDDQPYSPTNVISTSPTSLDIASPITFPLDSHSQQTPPTPALPSSKPRTRTGTRNAAKRAAHNIIEKRYRTNMNAKFAALEKAMGSRGPNSGKETSKSKLPSSGGKSSSSSLKKSEILRDAIAYVRELQEANERLRREVEMLRDLRGYC
ncbi:uncharacterized protein BJX67DRAFT_29457 [Aspergillus lucknowensis]|uniref:BHLH domain-containing protein n=1 Tax=Aspergillus lucknowensis TaxID=176173 RepID=A0ABR4LWL3_9EURO